MRPAPFGQLHRSRADAARGAGDQHTLRPQCRALDHPFGSRKGAWKRSELNVRECAVDPQRIAGLGGGIFSKTAIPFRSEGDQVIRPRPRRAVHGPDQNPLANPPLIDPLTHGHDLSAAIGALDARKAQGAGPAAIGVRGAVVALARRRPGVASHRFGIPARARVHIRVVHRRRADADQNLSGCGLWHRNVFAPLQLVQAAVAGQPHGFHRLW